MPAPTCLVGFLPRDDWENSSWSWSFDNLPGFGPLLGSCKVHEDIGKGLLECVVPALSIRSFVLSPKPKSEVLWYSILQMWKLRFRPVATPA